MLKKSVELKILSKSVYFTLKIKNILKQNHNTLIIIIVCIYRGRVIQSCPVFVFSGYGHPILN